MPSYVISLKRTPERLRAFNDFNGHSEFSVFEAVDGSLVNRRAVIDSGVIDTMLPYSHGALGNALSHLELWKKCAAGTEIFNICEDDALLHQNFDQYSNFILQKLPEDWDLIFWGWNFDSILAAQFLGAKMPLVMFFKQDDMRLNSRQYLSTPVEPIVLKMRYAFGTMCYSVTPRGAAKLLRHLLPLTDSQVVIDALNRNVRNTSLDIAMNRVYDSLNCFACFPPIALTHNDRAASTVYGN